MTTRIAVRLSDELVGFVDELVDSGAGRSRTAVVRAALERERRRRLAERDAEILARTSHDVDLAELAEHATSLPFRLDRQAQELSDAINAAFDLA
jgi:Arc/MetJ-type ribon-helix-helix transcriptional regulator